MSIATEITRLQTAKANIKTAIEEKGVTVGDGTIDTYAEKIGEISGGDNPLEYAIRLIQTYYGVIFPENYELTINVPYIEQMDSMFGGSSTQGNLKRLIVKGNVSNNALILNRMVYGAHSNTLEEIDFSELNLNISSLSRAFYVNSALKRILGEFDLTNCTDVTGTFSLCAGLEEVRFKKESIFISIAFESSSLLSAESIQSIIDGLADLTGSTTQTLTLHATVGGNLTQTQRDAITAKNWTLAY